MPSTYTPTLILTFCIVFVTLLQINVASQEGFWPCKPCATTTECDSDPVEACIWGEAVDACGRRVCAKGPGERCGGPLNLLGECGEGMMCKDERCHGCSIQTLQCHP